MPMSIAYTILMWIFALIPLGITGFVVYLIWKLKQNSDQILQLLKAQQK
ncbi:MAG: hypothetical protein ACRC6H_10030 [Culicoidibacterales bacterium]